MPRVPENFENDRFERRELSDNIQRIERIVAKANIKLHQDIKIELDKQLEEYKQDMIKFVAVEIAKHYDKKVSPAIKQSVVEAFDALDIDFNDKKEVAQLRDAARWVIEKLAANKQRRNSLLYEVTKTVVLLLVTCVVSWLLFTLKLRTASP